MREPYRVDLPGAHHTVFTLRGRTALRHYQPPGVFSIVALLASLYGVGTGQGWALWTVLATAGLGALSFGLYRSTPAEHHELEFQIGAIRVDDATFSIDSFSYILTDDKAVFRDAANNVEWWHGIPSQRDRTRLRLEIEDALHAAKGHPRSPRE